MEPLCAKKLDETPREIIDALLWAYRRIESLHTTLAQAISRGCTCDYLYGATCGIHKLGTEAGIKAAVEHLKALEEAARFVRQFLLNYEAEAKNQIIRDLLAIYHKPLHTKLDAALKGVPNV